MSLQVLCGEWVVFVEELDSGENVRFSSTVLTCGSVLAHAGDGCTALLCVDLVNRARGTKSIQENEEELVDVVSGGGLQGEDGSGVLDMDDGVDVDVDSGGGGEMDEEDEEVVMKEPKPLRRSPRIALLPQVDYSLSRRATRLRRSPRLAKLKRVNYKE